MNLPQSNIAPPASISACIPAPAKRPNSRSSATSGQPKVEDKTTRKKSSWQAIRIREISSTIDRSKFHDILTQLTEGNESNLLGWSFCPHPVTIYGERYDVATVSFQDIPPTLSGSGQVTLDTRHGRITVHTDRHFLGLTPLSSPPLQNTT